LLGLSLDGSRLEGVVLKRHGDALQLVQSFTVTLTLDPLTAAPELVGREIRNQLDSAGVRERNCIFGVPLKWVMTAQTELPPLPEADAASLLQIEAERGFHADVATLQIANSRTPLAGDKKSVLLAGIPSNQIASIEKILAAAKLRPVSFSLGLPALQPATSEKSNGVLALFIGGSNVGLQVTGGGGVVALRTLEGAVEDEAGRRTLHAEMVARETRITLGQMPAELRDSVKRIRIFGPRDLARDLANELEPRFEPLGLKVEVVAGYAPDEFGVTLPPDVSLSPAFSLAARYLIEQKPAFEFLPPKPGLIEQFVTKYSSGRLRTSGAIAAGVVLLVVLLFLYQQVWLWVLGAKWDHMADKVGQLQAISANISQYRPWEGGAYNNLAILRQLSLSFPENGSVTAKSIEVHDGNTVACSGTALNYESLLAMQSNLQKAPGVSDVRLQQVRGKAPMQFTFGFKINIGGGQ
jgi:hypothetical protein